MIAPSKAAVDAWARRELKVAEDASPLEVRQAALRLVGSTQFAPSFDDSVAIGVALGRPRDSVEAFQQEAFYSRDEEALRLAIDQFARDFFSFSQDLRTRRWRELDAIATIFPWWRARLARLEKGLAVERPTQFANLVAEAAFSMFALSPAERAVERRALVDTLSRDKLSAAVDEAKRAHPELASLGVFDDFIVKPPSQPTFTTTRNEYVSYAAPTIKTPPPQQSARWVAGVIIFVAVTIVRIMTADSTTPRRPAPPFEQGRQFAPQNFDNIVNPNDLKKLRLFRDDQHRDAPDVEIPDFPRRPEGQNEKKVN